MRRVLFLMVVLVAATAASSQNLYKLEDVQSGMLLVKTTPPGIYAEAEPVNTDVRLTVEGMILRGEVTQRFHNSAPMCVEAIYAFPLPENSAVDRLRMTIGSRVVEGQLRVREEAERVYEEAKSEGKHASLMTQERPNLFTVTIANIASNEEVVVTIDYQQTVEYRDGAFRARFPLTIGQRYEPPSVEDRRPRLSNPPVDPNRRNRVSLVADIDAGLSLSEITSTYHAIDKRALSGSRYEVTLAGGSVAGDHDFELTWKPILGSEPKAATFVQSSGNDRYALIMLMPPAAANQVRLPRESIFIIDTSGSMSGTSINEAKSALKFALSRLASSDRFNVIEFNSVMHSLFTEPRPATLDAINQATGWVDGLEADGGTEMRPALEAALRDDRAEETTTVRQVVFMTDGQVSNEDELFALISSRLGRSRLFTVGIGAAPNSHFMSSAARFGRGTFTYIGGVSEVEEKMTSLFTKLESPVLTNVAVRVDDETAEVWPARVPDLYAGEPVILVARMSRRGGRAVVTGSVGTRPWSDAQSLGAGSVDSGIDKLWARQKIESLMDSLVAAENSDVKHEVIELALAHHLVSQFTSLVAVDVTPAGVPAEPCQTQRLPVNLPEGAENEDGSLPSTATPAPLFLLLGSLFFVAAAVMARRS